MRISHPCAAQVCDAGLARCGATRLVLVGFSMGCLHVTRFANTLRDGGSASPGALGRVASVLGTSSVEAIALVCPAGLAPAGSELERRVLRSPLFPLLWSELLDVGATFVVRWQRDDFREALESPDEPTRAKAEALVATSMQRVTDQVNTNPDYVARVGAQMRDVTRRPPPLAVALEKLRDAAYPKPHVWLDEAPQPRMLVVVGADDTVVGDALKHARDQNLLPKKATVVEIPDTGHQPMMTHPNAVAFALANLVDDDMWRMLSPE